MYKNQKIGYACDSDAQGLGAQRDALSLAGCCLVFEESSTKRGLRPELNKCLDSLVAGDTLVICQLDRLADSLTALLAATTELNNRGVWLESLKEDIKTAGNSGQVVLGVFNALASFENNLVRGRAQAGLRAARARGRLGGRKPKLKEKDLIKIKELLKNPDLAVSDVAKKFGVSRSTIYNHVGVIKPEKSGNKR